MVLKDEFFEVPSLNISKIKFHFLVRAVPLRRRMSMIGTLTGSATNSSRLNITGQAGPRYSIVIEPFIAIFTYLFI